MALLSIVSGTPTHWQHRVASMKATVVDKSWRKAKAFSGKQQLRKKFAKVFEKQKK
jgi:hypothetical protein